MDSWKVEVKARNQVDLVGDIVQKKISRFFLRINMIMCMFGIPEHKCSVQVQ